MEECIKSVFQTDPDEPVHAYEVVNKYTLRVENEHRMFFDIVAFLPHRYWPLRDNGELDIKARRGTLSFAKRGNLWDMRIVELARQVKVPYSPSAAEQAAVSAALITVQDLESQWEALKPQLKAAWEKRYAAISRAIREGTLQPEGKAKPSYLQEASDAYDVLERRQKDLESRRDTALKSPFIGPIRRL
ncbi:MAG: hypothetical protein EOP84_20000 [Verrucomicrobiaceae bacterium]|nr:MAG: hypothetical protein EOP84_20000 [Verrucomicrobiaceae bacterium]